MSIRTLAQATQAARNQRLEVTPTLMPEVLLECPTCKQHGTRSLARIERINGALHPTCNTCELHDDDPYEILRILGHNPDHNEPHEITLRIFDLLWALHRNPA